MFFVTVQELSKELFFESTREVLTEFTVSVLAERFEQ